MKRKTGNSESLEIMDAAVKAVCCEFGITREELCDTTPKGRSRKRPLTYARMVYSALCVIEYNRNSLPEHLIPLAEIGGMINKDHSNVHHMAYTSHPNHMYSRNSDYIPHYYRARKSFVDFLTTKGNVLVGERLAQIRREQARLRVEEEKLMEIVNQ